MAGKYAPLTAYLVDAAGHGRESVELSFAELADLVGGLPPSASEHRAWWANGTLSQQAAWRVAGWRVGFPDLERRRVRFVRDAAPSATSRRSLRQVEAVELPLDEDTPALDVRVRCMWRIAGEVGLSGGKLVFPSLPEVAAIYRLTLNGLTGRPRIYVGETDNLQRRMNGYRAPGPRSRRTCGSSTNSSGIWRRAARPACPWLRRPRSKRAASAPRCR